MAYVDVLCTVCAGKISLHEGMKYGYCTLCGSRISLADAKAGKMDPDVIKRLSGDELFHLALNADNDLKLMDLAAEKDSAEANQYMGIHYTTNSEYGKSLPYWKKAAEAGLATGKAGYASMLLHENNDPDEYPYIIKLAKEALAGDCMESMVDICKNLIDTLQPMVEKRNHARWLDSEYKKASRNRDYTRIEELAVMGHQEAIETVEYVKRKTVCRYYNNGLCNYKSTASYLHHCYDRRNAACSDYRMQD